MYLLSNIQIERQTCMGVRFDNFYFFLLYDSVRFRLTIYYIYKKKFTFTVMYFGLWLSTY